MLANRQVCAMVHRLHRSDIVSYWPVYTYWSCGVTIADRPWWARVVNVLEVHDELRMVQSLLLLIAAELLKRPDVVAD